MTTKSMTLEAFRSAESYVVTALRALKELEAPPLVMSHGPAGGPYRARAMERLRAALHDLVLALDYHRFESVELRRAPATAAAVTGERPASRAPTS